MKLLVILLAVLVLVWLLTGSRRRRVDRPAASAKSAPKPAAAPIAMIACAQCGIHMPRAETLPGRGGAFCGEAHRAAFESAHPSP